MTPDKKRVAWVTPELIVLARSRPEEAVLGFCKITATGGGPSTVNAGCITVGAPCEVCSGMVYS